MTVLYSREAEYDLLDIAFWSRAGFGKRLTDRYIDELEMACEKLGAALWGSRRMDFDHDLFRFVHQHHVIYFRADAQRILISRILHGKQLASLHHFPDRTSE